MILINTTQKVEIGDNRELIKKLPNNFIDCCITSPPYWRARNYNTPPLIYGGESGCDHIWNDIHVSLYSSGVKKVHGVPTELKYAICTRCNAFRGELGWEPTPEGFISHLVDIFDILKPKLKDTGSVWVNLGDKYFDSSCKHDFLKPRSLCMIPERFAWKMIEHGFLLINKPIWHKKNNMPEPYTRRLTKTYEPLYHFVKNPDYFYDLDIIREPHKTKNTSASIRKIAQTSNFGKTSAFNGNIEHSYHILGKNPGDLFSIDEEGFDFSKFPVQTHTKVIAPEIFKNLFAFFGVVIKKLEDCTSTMFFDSSKTDVTIDSELISDYIQQFLSTAPTQANLTFFRGNAYATITIEYSSNKVSVEFGRNRWIFFKERLSGDNVKQEQVFSHSYAINLQSISVPLLILINWVRGTPLILDIINQFNIFRSELNSCIVSEFACFDTPIGGNQPQNVGGVTVIDDSEIFMVESVLGIILYSIRIAMSKPPFVVHTTKSLTSSNPITLIDTAFSHIIPLSYINSINNKSTGDVWSINTVSYTGNHFATFPLALVKRPILATCPKFICKKCGKPRERIMKSETIDRSATNDNGNGAFNNGSFGSSIHHQIGWRDCGCGAEFESGWVLDLFCGSGSVLEFCRKNGYNAIGFDLNPDYKSLAEDRAMLHTPQIKPAIRPFTEA